jgi:uncharacterized protein YajQ (UPF0234 family)
LQAFQSISKHFKVFASISKHFKAFASICKYLQAFENIVQHCPLGLSLVLWQHHFEMRCSMPSFDVVSKTEITDVDNALQGVAKEMQVRYDFKGSMSEVTRNEDVIIIKADDELKRRQVEELLITHLTRKGVDAKALDFQKIEQASSNTIRQNVLVQQGIGREVAQKIVKAIKGAKTKTQASIQGDEVRISGKKRDDLQAAIALIKELDIELPLQFVNFRD